VKSRDFSAFPEVRVKNRDDSADFFLLVEYKKSVSAMQADTR